MSGRDQRPFWEELLISSLRPSVVPPAPAAPPGVAILPLRDSNPRPHRAISVAPSVPFTVGTPSDTPSERYRGKGAKHANACPGPWAASLRSMPPPPVTGRKRALAGLGDVPLPSAEVRSVSQERSARALVAILPHGCAAYIISSPQSYVDSLPPEEVAEAMVGVLSGFGVSSLNAAAAALGSFLSWMMSTHPAATCAFGHHFAQYLRLPGLSPATLTSFKWLRDWCGISSPVYGPVFKAFSRQSSHSSSNDKESLSFRVLLGLEEIAATDASEFVRGHAAAWFLLCMAALRREQSSDCCISSVVVHRASSAVGTVLVAASSRDKNPNPALACPRPVWAGISGIRHPGAVRSALLRMLGAAPLARCLLPDTDSPIRDRG